MKTIKILFLLSLMFILSACSSNSLEDYKEMLIEAGWEVEITTIEEYADSVGGEISEEDEGVVAMLFANKGTIWDEDFKVGFIIEFETRAQARDYVNELKEEEEEDNEFTDYIRQRGVFVFLSFTEQFLKDINMD